MDENMIELSLENLNQAEAELLKIGCDSKGIQIMKSKAVFKVIKFANIRTKAANLLKQTFLSKGADVAVARGTADLSVAYTDVLIMATVKQYRQAIPILMMQPWGLVRVAKQIENFLDNLNEPPVDAYICSDREDVNQ